MQTAPEKLLRSVLVKPAGPDCNMACSYCFYLKKSGLFKKTRVHRMKENVLREMIRQVLKAGAREVSFGWQGGEPTLMGLEFFQKAVSFQQEYGRGQSVANGLQTNGICIDNSWVRFLKQYRFLVGLSLDGPLHVHNHYRLLKGGEGTWKTVVDKARLLLDGGVDVNALTVVNDYSVQFPEEIYRFHKSCGLNHMQFIPCVEPDPADPARAAPYSVSAEDYGRFLRTLFDLWTADFSDGLPATFIRFFDSVFFNYVGLTPPLCTLSHTCGDYVVVEHNGDVFSCDFFVEPAWKLGNILKGNISNMLNSSRQRNFGRQKADRPQVCDSCRWLQYCWGGCIKDRFQDPRDKGRNHFCQAYKLFFEHADSTLTRLAEKWRKQQLSGDAEGKKRSISNKE
jgi:uncharacterized protein